MSNTKNLYTIRQASHSCGIGRTTLQRMEEDGMVEPAFIGENKYHYYDAKTIYDINMLTLFQECGFSRTELRKIRAMDDPLKAFEKILQNRINVLTFNLQNVKAASRADLPPEFVLMDIPDLTCFVTEGKATYSLNTMYKLVSTSIDKVVQKGLLTNKYYTPFLILRNLSQGGPSSKGSSSYYSMCIPIADHRDIAGIQTIKGGHALAVTFVYKEGLGKEYIRLLYNELERSGLEPKSSLRAEALFNPLTPRYDKSKRMLLRLSVMI